MIQDFPVLGTAGNRNAVHAVTNGAGKLCFNLYGIMKWGLSIEGEMMSNSKYSSFIYRFEC